MKKLGKNVDATIHNLARARYTKRQRNALLIAQCLREIMDPRDAERLAGAYAETTPNPDANRWTFAMISPAQNAAVVEWLHKNSKRRTEAVRLWATLFTVLHPTTGEIMLSRGELATRLDLAPRTISELMSELETINAIHREKEGRNVRYRMNPHIATHLPDARLREQAREQAGPLLTLMQGGAI